MKTRRFLWVFFMVLSFIALCSMMSFAQPRQAEVPGDDFSLEGALELFKKSASPEDFERQLNSSNSRVNNLDLNGDGTVDYIRVIDRNERNVHAFILQAVVSEWESQDVAVIELEKRGSGNAVLQITGDADIYGVETIIEPTTEVRVNAGTSAARTVVNVWSWPAVQYVYDPFYAVWVSPWRWNARPIWWRTWRPVAYYVYDPWWQPYRAYYSVCNTHRIVYAQQIYRPVRTTSFVVYSRHHDQIVNYRNGQGRDRYYGQRTDRNTATYEQRSNTDRERSATQDRNSLGQSRSMNNQQQPDWRNNGSLMNQNQSVPHYSVDRMNRPGEQRTNRETFSNQNQMRRTTDFQRVPQNTDRMNRMPGTSNSRELNIQRGQTITPSREFNRQSVPSNSGRTLSKPSGAPSGDQRSKERRR